VTNPGDHDPASTYDVAIIGAGIVGCAIARELTRYRLRVLLIDKEIEVGFGISKANSGIIHGGHHASPASLKGRLEWSGNQMWDQLCKDLGFGFQRIGELTVALAPEQLPTLEKLQQQGRDKGVPGLEMWDAVRVRSEEPNLSADIVAALYAPTTGVINPYEACFALTESACRNGLDLLLGARVIGLTQEDGGWLVATSRGPRHARFVLNAAGIEADRIAGLAGAATFTLTARKGEEYLLDRRLAGIVRRIIFPCPTPVSKGILVIPTYDGTIMVGPTAGTVEDREDLDTTHAGAAAVFAAVQRVVPGISERDCIAEFAGVRAVADTEDFVLGPSSRPGFLNVAGIQSPGLTAAPAIATMVVDLLRTEGLALVENAEFIAEISAPIHFAALSLADQIDLVARRPAFGRIVCRCEYVTEGEIAAAIARGACSLDGLKFRTRAGMGRCQGGFCLPRCVELLADASGAPMTSVTKRGGNSWIICEREDEGES